jgi:RNA polymerase sigma factor (sigma-70 family)
MDYVIKIGYNARTIDYSLLFMQIAEFDVIYLSNRFRVKGYTKEDIAQELRLKLWEALPYYNPEKTGMRTWSRTVMRNHLKNLKRNVERHKRKVLYYQVPIEQAEQEQAE